jgi:hypothetical protein
VFSQALSTGRERRGLDYGESNWNGRRDTARPRRGAASTRYSDTQPLSGSTSSPKPDSERLVHSRHADHHRVHQLSAANDSHQLFGRVGGGDNIVGVAIDGNDLAFVAFDV